jgi:hypothetical protein
VADRLEDVQKLALVFVDPLDLHVEDRVGIDRDAKLRVDPAGRRTLFARLAAP